MQRMVSRNPTFSAGGTSFTQIDKRGRIIFLSDSLVLRMRFKLLVRGTKEKPLQVFITSTLLVFDQLFLYLPSNMRDGFQLEYYPHTPLVFFFLGDENKSCSAYGCTESPYGE